MGTIFSWPFTDDTNVGPVVHGQNFGWGVSSGADLLADSIITRCSAVTLGHNLGPDNLTSEQGVEVTYGSWLPHYTNNRSHYYLRARVTDLQTFYEVWLNSGTLYIDKVVAGSRTSLTSTAAPSNAVCFIGAVMRLNITRVASRDVLSLLINGTEVLSVTNSAADDMPSGGQAGWGGTGDYESHVRRLRTFSSAGAVAYDYHPFGKNKYLVCTTNLTSEAATVVPGEMNSSASGLVTTGLKAPKIGVQGHYVDEGSVEVTLKSTSNFNGFNLFLVGDKTAFFQFECFVNTFIRLFRTNSFGTTQLGSATITALNDGTDQELILSYNYSGTPNVSATVTGKGTISATPGIEIAGVKALYLTSSQGAAILDNYTFSNMKMKGLNDTAPTTPTVTASTGNQSNGVAISWNTPDSDVIAVEVKRDSTVLYTYEVDSREPLVEAYRDEPSVGTYSYTVTFTNRNGNSAAATVNSVAVPVSIETGPGPISATATIGAITADATIA